MNLMRTVEKISSIEKSLNTHETTLTSVSLDVLNLAEQMKDVQNILNNVKLGIPSSKTPTGCMKRHKVNEEKSVVKLTEKFQNLIDEKKNESCENINEDNNEAQVNNNDSNEDESYSENTFLLDNSGIDSESSDDSVKINNILKKKVKLIDEDGYTKMENRKNRKKRLIEESAKLLKGAPPPVVRLFISRVSFGTENTIDNYLRKNGIKPVSVNIVSRSDAKYSSYKASVYKNDVDTILEEHFWPRGISCRLWREQRDTYNKSKIIHQTENRRRSDAGSSRSLLRSRIINSSKYFDRNESNGSSRSYFN